MRPGRLVRSAVVFKLSTLLRPSSADTAEVSLALRPATDAGPKGLSQDVIAVVDMKQRNSDGRPRIAQQITLAFGIL